MDGPHREAVTMEAEYKRERDAARAEVSRLREEVERLRADAALWKESAVASNSEVERLREEVERLTRERDRGHGEGVEVPGD